MDVSQVLHMVGGEGDDSYAKNSLLQKLARGKAKSMVEEAVIQVFTANSPSSRIVIADLGCSSGPNTLLTIHEIIATILNKCIIIADLGSAPPEMQFFLNDLPGNDFNTVFRSIPTFCADIKQEIDGVGSLPLFIAGVPGSYFERLFLKESVHFMHSSYSLHYLSQVPQLLQSEFGDPSLNKRNIYLMRSTPVEVVASYSQQFRKDFSLFLSLRSEELVAGGRAVLLLLGRKSKDPTHGECCYMWGSLAEALDDMVSEGFIDEADLDVFNLPFYFPHLDEVKAIVEEEGSFVVERERTFDLHWDPIRNFGNEVLHDNNVVGSMVAKYVKAVIEPLLRSHFSSVDMDELFSRFAKKVTDLPQEKQIHDNIAVTLKKR